MAESFYLSSEDILNSYIELLSGQIDVGDVHWQMPVQSARIEIMDRVFEGFRGECRGGSGADRRSILDVESPRPAIQRVVGIFSSINGNALMLELI